MVTLPADDTLQWRALVALHHLQAPGTAPDVARALCASRERIKRAISGLAQRGAVVPAEGMQQGRWTAWVVPAEVAEHLPADTGGVGDEVGLEEALRLLRRTRGLSAQEERRALQTIVAFHRGKESSHG